MNEQGLTVTQDSVKDTSKTKVNTWPIVILLVLIYVLVAMSDNFKGIFVPFFKGSITFLPSGINAGPFGGIIISS